MDRQKLVGVSRTVSIVSVSCFEGNADAEKLTEK
jgi:hypothetical protein